MVFECGLLYYWRGLEVAVVLGGIELGRFGALDFEEGFTGSGSLGV